MIFLKESFNTPVKIRVRKELREFLRHNITEKEPNILCLSGPEAIEIKDIYDRLEYTRSNITTCEIDKDSYNLLIAQELGIEVYNGDVLNYTEKTNKKFDIISLDFCGTFNPKVFNTISNIFSRNLLNNNGALIISLSIRREKEDVQYLYKLPFMLLSHTMFNHYKAFDYGIRSETIFDKLPEEILKDDKIYRDGIDLAINLIAMMGKGNSDPKNNINNWGKKFEDFANKVTELTKVIEKEEKSLSDEEICKILISVHDAICESNQIIASWRGMFPIRNQRYIYHSDTGTPMKVTFLTFRRTENELRDMGWEDFAKKHQMVMFGFNLAEVTEISSPKTIQENGDGNMNKKIAEKIDEITKKRIIRALKAGVEKPKIARIFGVTKMQVSAIDAWITMGKY